MKKGSIFPVDYAECSVGFGEWWDVDMTLGSGVLVCGRNALLTLKFIIRYVTHLRRLVSLMKVAKFGQSCCPT